MRGTVICFTGFANKKDLDHLNNLAHLMGASTRQNHVPSVTHVVAADVNGSQCQVNVLCILGYPDNMLFLMSMLVCV